MIQKLAKKSIKERKKILILAIVATSIIIILLWTLSFYQTLQKQTQKKSVDTKLNELSEFKQEFNKNYQELKALTQNLADTSQTPATPPSLPKSYE